MSHSVKLMPDVVLIALSLTHSACGGGGGTVITNPPGTARSPALSFEIKPFRFTWYDISEATCYRLFENSDGSSVSARWVAIFHRARKHWIMLCCSTPVSMPVTSCKKYAKYKSPLQHAFISNRSGIF